MSGWVWGLLMITTCEAVRSAGAADYRKEKAAVPAE